MLNSMYPGNFPSSWTMQNGSTVNNGSGQIIVLSTPAPVIQTQPQSLTVYAQQPASFSVIAMGNSPLAFHWHTNTTALTDNGNRTGSASNILTIASASASH